MEAYLWTFINFEQNNWTKLSFMVEFTYNNAKNANINHMPFKLNFGYYPCVFFNKNTNPYSWSKSADELSAALQDLITVYWKNFYHTQKF